MNYCLRFTFANFCDAVFFAKAVVMSEDFCIFALKLLKAWRLLQAD